MKPVILFINAIVIFSLLVVSCDTGKSGKRTVMDNRLQKDSILEVNDLSKRAEEIADSILATMTIEKKGAQLIMPALFSSDDKYTLMAVRDYGKKGVCGVVLLKGDSQSAKEISDSLRINSAIIPFVSIDAEWGLGMRLSDEPSYPFNSEIGEDATEVEMFRYGNTVGDQCHKVGINMVLGPVLDVAGKGSFMWKRSYGDDPVRVSNLAVSYARGLESKGVMSVAKHFPGHGSAKGDSHRSKPVIERSLHQMDSIDLYPFKKYIAAGLSAVMVGHLAVPAIDPEMEPAAISHTVISDLLQRDLGFKGLVLTDALTMGGAEGAGAVKAVKAGADIILAPRDTEKEIRGIVEAVGSGELSEERLDKSVKKILFYKSLMKLREN